MIKVLIMGAGINQMPLIEVAVSMNYFVVLCDANKDAIGKKKSNVFYTIDISKVDEIIRICKLEKVDGVVCNTESLMSVLADVQSILGFVGNERKAIDRINNKYLFRQIQKSANVFAPNTKKFEDYSTAYKYVCEKNRKMIMKPELSSGSMGILVINSIKDFLEKDFNNSCLISRNSKVLIEDYVDFSMKKALESEVFLLDGKIELMCLFRTIRDRKYDILPQCYCSDNEIDDRVEKEIQETLQKIFTEAGIQWGEYNVELSFNEKNEIFVIEINVRQGGMMLPDFVRIYTGIDINKLLVSTAVGDFEYYRYIKKKGYVIDKNCIHFRVLVDRKGYYKGYDIDCELKPYIANEFQYMHPDIYVSPKNGDYISVALIDFKFDKESVRKNFENSVFEKIKVKIEE